MRKLAAKSPRSFFEREGYWILDAGIPKSTLDRAVKEAQPHYGAWRVGDGPMRKQDAWLACPSVRAIALHPEILRTLRLLYGREPLPFQTLNFPVGTQQPAHSDTVHFNSAPAGFVAGVWVALEDIDEDNGPLVYYPSSQRLPEYTPAKLGLPPGHDHYPKLESHIAGVIAKKALKPLHATLKKGQALVWAGNLLHGGALQKDKNRTRHTQVTHYFFEGCRYWTPLLSSPGKREYRDPQWIV